MCICIPGHSGYGNKGPHGAGLGGLHPGLGPDGRALANRLPNLGGVHSGPGGNNFYYEL